jgi:hypothetical protein
MTYNFRDEPAPVLASQIDSTGTLNLAEGTPQGDLITDNFTGSSVSVSIRPPRGWSLDEVVWASGGSGTFPIPEPDVEEIHQFSYRVSRDGVAMSDNGHFKIKKQGNGGSTGG